MAGTPLAVLVNGIMGRYLGAEAFGHIYVASTLARLGFLFVEWGHNGVLPAGVARDRSLAGEYLATSLTWRVVMAVVVFLALALGSWLLGYTKTFQIVLALVAMQWLLGSLATACQDVVKGYERTDVTAAAQLGTQLLSVLIVVPILVLGGGLTATLLGQLAGAAILLVFVWIVTRRISPGPLLITRRAFRELFGQGSYFLSFGVAMALQANVDTVLLKELAPGEVVGWQAAAQRLAGVLVIPASALISALYPTLSRLHHEDPDGYIDTVRRALRGTVLLAIPMGVCCALYRELGIRLFSKEQFAQAEQNLLFYAVLIPLVYVSMPLGTALLAAGRQRAWAAVQMLCVVVSIGLDPFLIPWFQKHYGNGGLGVCFASVFSEIFMVLAGLLMMKRGIVSGTLLVALGKAVLAGGVMVGAGFVLRSITPFVAAPIVLLVYAAFLWVIGGIQKDEIDVVKGTILRKLKR